MLGKRGKIIIGITGGIGTGKTTVAKMFKRLGAEVIDCDRIVHSLVSKKMRDQLSKFVFNRKVYLDRLNKIIHPVVISVIEEKIKKIKKKDIVIDAPLLIETGLDKICDKVICIKTKKNIQILRKIRSSKLKREDVVKRMRFQIPLSQKLKRADFVVDNNGTIKETQRQVIKVWEKLKGVNYFK